MGVLLDLTSMIGIKYKRVVKHRELAFINANIKIGDIIACHRPWQLSNLFIPGSIDHVGIYSSTGIIDATVKNGVSSNNLEEWLSTYEEYYIMTPLFLEDARRNDIDEMAIKQIGKEYDANLNLCPESFYCSELAYTVYKSVTGIEPVEVKQYLWRSFILPKSFIFSPLWTKLYHYKEAKC